MTNGVYDSEELRQAEGAHTHDVMRDLSDEQRQKILERFPNASLNKAYDEETALGRETPDLTAMQRGAIEKRYGKSNPHPGEQRDAYESKETPGGGDTTQSSLSQQEEQASKRPKTPEELKASANEWDEDEKPFRNNFLNRHKKGITGTIIGLLTGGTLAGFFGISLFGGTLKIDSIMTNLQNRFDAAAVNVERKEVNVLLDRYITKHLLAGMGLNLCRDLEEVTKSCFVPVTGEGPVKSLFRAWAQNHIEAKLSEDAGIDFVKNKTTGEIIMKVAGKAATVPAADLAAMASGSESVSGVAVRLGLAGDKFTVDDLLDKALLKRTIWNRAYYRFIVGPLLEKKYGIKLCLWGCKAKSDPKSNTQEQQNFGETSVEEDVIKPESQDAGNMLNDLVKGDDSKETLQQTTDPALDQQTAVANSVEAVQAAADVATEDAVSTDLADLTSKAAAEVVDGVTTEVATKVADVGLEEAVTGATPAAVGESADPATWALVLAQIVHGLSTAGKIIQFYGYAIKAYTAVRLFTIFLTIESELHSGHMNIAVLGSMTQLFTTNMTGSKNDRSDATSTPLYAKLFGGGVDPSKTNYQCNDGSKVPGGQFVCPEEVFTAGNQTISGISNFLNAIPGLVPLANLLNTVNNLLGDITNFLFQQACQLPGVSQGCTAVGNAISGAIGGFMQWLLGVLLPMPFSDAMSGGRMFDMVAGGADVTYNKSCQVNLGCSQLSNQQISAIQNDEMAFEKRQFDAQPLFARIFSTDTPYSLISRLAMIWPTNLEDASTHIATILGNPISAVGTIMSSIFSAPHAFAATQPFNDPFGVIQYGYADNQIPTDPENYWDQYCQNNPNFAIDWENSQQQDPNTGEAVAASPMPCLLIQSSTQSAGVMFDSSLAPAGSLNPDPTQ